MYSGPFNSFLHGTLRTLNASLICTEFHHLHSDKRVTEDDEEVTVYAHKDISSVLVCFPDCKETCFCSPQTHS